MCEKEEIEKKAKEKREENYQKMMGLKVKNTVTEIFSRNDDFAIYGTNAKCLSNSISYSIASLNKETNDILKISITKFRTEYNKARGVLHKSNDIPLTKAKIAGILLHGFTLGISMSKEDVEKHDFVEVKQQFNELVKEVNKEYEYQFSCRLKYMTIILVLSMFFIGISVLISCNYLSVPIDDIFFYLAAMGSIGCALSVSRKLKQIIFENDTCEEKQEKTKQFFKKFPTVFLYACQRILISVFCAVVSYFAIRANLLFGFANDSGVYLYLIVACVAGFSETLIPDFLTKIERKKEVQDE